MFFERMFYHFILICRKPIASRFRRFAEGSKLGWWWTGCLALPSHSIGGGGGVPTTNHHLPFGWWPFPLVMVVVVVRRYIEVCRAGQGAFSEVTRRAMVNSQGQIRLMWLFLLTVSIMVYDNYVYACSAVAGFAAVSISTSRYRFASSGLVASHFAHGHDERRGIYNFGVTLMSKVSCIYCI